MKNPVAFLLLELVAWVMVVGGWLNMDCETGGGARILAYTVGLVIFTMATTVNYAVNGDGSDS